MEEMKATYTVDGNLETTAVGGFQALNTARKSITR